MNKDKLNALLDSIYELEGLVHLALTREDEPKSLPELIVRKAEELPRLVAETVRYEEPGLNSFPTDSELDMLGLCIDPVSEEPHIEVLFQQDTASIPVNEQSSVSYSTAPQDKEHEDEIRSKSRDFNTYTAKTEIRDNTYVQKTHVNEPRVITESRVVSEPRILKESTGLRQEVSRPAPVQPTDSNKVVVPESKVDQNFAKKTDNVTNNIEPRGRLVFTINDRYRFKRDLFNSSDADFNTSLALVASMDSYEEAEDYFLGDLQWQPQREEVIDFLEILKNYFK